MIAAGAASAAAPPVSGKAEGEVTPPSKPTPEQLAEAKRHMEAGAAFYNDAGGTHKCEEAYPEFLKAYELSGSLKALKAMGICALLLERDGDAIERFEKYLAGKGSQIEASDKAQVESDLKALKVAVARVTFRSDRGSTRVTDVRTPSQGSPVTNTYTLNGEQTLGIHPGRHTFTASVDGSPPLSWSTEIANGGTYEHTFDFSGAAAAGATPPPPPAGSSSSHADVSPPPNPPPAPLERPVPVSVFVFGGLTVALAVPTVVLMARASGKNSDYEAQNGALPGATLESLKSDVKTANLVADVFLGATAASLVATGIFYFTRPTRARETSPVVSWTVAPIIHREGGGAHVLGRF